MVLRRSFTCRWGKVKTLLVILLLSCTLHLLFFVNYALNMKKDRHGSLEILLKETTSKSESTKRPDPVTTAIRPTEVNPPPPAAPEKPAAVKRDCNSPELIQDGVPWPHCGGKTNWMKGNWKKDKCYASYGVSDEPCSMVKYLSEVEHHCPPDPNDKPKLQPLYLNGEVAEPRSTFQHLYNEIGIAEDYSWIKSRIKSLESLWISSSSRLFTEESPKRMRKRIHLHLGLMSMGLGKSAWNGGPLGELVQWSDLIASLFIMGHDIVITRKKAEVDFVYKDYKSRWSNSGCPPPTLGNQTKIPFDIVYTDITGLKELRKVIGNSAFTPMECRTRVVDSFGTEASFNYPPYRQLKKVSTTEYNGLDIDLRQFNTMFPHTPDNTFLGFVTEFPPENRTIVTSEPTKRDIALVYGKLEDFWKGKEKYIDIIKEYVTEVHATVHDPKNLSSYIVNHGVVGPDTLSAIMKRTKIFVGLGFPFEGPAPLEAIQSGAVFLNPKFRKPISSLNHVFYRKKPTRRKITSQNPYAEKYIGKPYVYTVDTDDENALREALKEITTAPEPGRFLSYEFSALGMLERVSTQVEKQQFCTKIPYSSPHVEEVKKLQWPPFSALIVHAAKRPGSETCNDICEAAGLICEPSFFPVLNREEGFERGGFTCNKTETPASTESDYPAYDNGNCYLQTNPKLFSCAENYMNLQRLCPCRDHLATQVALCTHCSLFAKTLT